ncbi:recombinase RecX [Rugosibacter aromaticivorans]|uniref:Regulatory protein RecX n=1 Tax=Rugosibacter aromaticivorans TaxID=1565605 RepID=A0A0C5IXL5_9PROT|nr:regulatory protein RecX [Rugosibacter aromaticivorans]AJP47447.1 recombinase RecX [Rugosibacter aromaticivorans]TBR15681.1 MAG: regulatory protein RecX [Rugosibacter sp.]
MNALRSRAIRLLARREHTRAELANKLAAHGTQEEINAVIAELQACHLQSDARFAENYVRAQAARLGTLRLRQNMLAKGLDRDLVESHLAVADMPDDLDRARSLWNRKFATAPANAKEWARQARFLQGRGFANDTIRRLLKAPLGEDDA